MADSLDWGNKLEVVTGKAGFVSAGFAFLRRPLLVHIVGHSERDVPELQRCLRSECLYTLWEKYL